MTLTAHRPRPDVCVVRVGGEVDLLTAPDLARHLREQTTPSTAHLVLDLSAVTLLSAAGVTVIVDAMQDMRNTHGRLHVVGAAGNRAAGRVLGISGLLTVLARHATVDELLDCLVDELRGRGRRGWCRCGRSGSR